MEQIKAIETHYNGFKFRSRLEARWAVFFDAAGIRYEYEPEGFKMNNGLCYLPDFYLPDENMYVEVKPPRKGAWKEILKASKFVGNGISCLLILPNIPEFGPHVYYFPILYFHPVDQDIRIKHVPFCADEEYEKICIARIYEDPFSRSFELLKIWDEAPQEHNEAECKKLLSPMVDYGELSIEAGIPAEAKFVEEAYGKARQARFEFGEKG